LTGEVRVGAAHLEGLAAGEVGQRQPEEYVRAAVEPERAKVDSGARGGHCG
jgi:hypothetical protein